MDLMFLRLDEQLQRLHESEACAHVSILDELERRFIGGWIYHDLSLEGWVFRDNEIQRALEGREGTSWLEIQLIAKIRQFKRAIEFITSEAHTRTLFELEFIKDIHRHLDHQDDDSAGHYRKDSGETRVYRHEMYAPSAISYRLRRLVSYVKAEADLLHPIEAGCEIHKRLVDIFPFQSDNGIVARLAMNYWLLRHGYPPVVFHVHDRQRYFDSYLSSNGIFQEFVVDSILAATESRIKTLGGLLVKAGEALSR